jgi:hypothetical protein
MGKDKKYALDVQISDVQICRFKKDVPEGQIQVRKYASDVPIKSVRMENPI